MAMTMIRTCRRVFWLGLILTLITSLTTARAQSPADTEQARKQEAAAAWRAAVEGATIGPATVPLLDQAQLRLPTDMIFVRPAPGARLLRAWGNKITVDPVGLVIGLRDADVWAIVLRFVKDGYIKDDDAKDWNADELLSNIREATEDANKDRVSRGFPELEVVG